MIKLISVIRRTAVFGVIGLFSSGQIRADVLITEQEAKLPADPTRERDVIRGPTVRVVSPAPGAGTVTSPLYLRVRFESHGGTTINLDSIKITYKRLPPVDLTQRVRPFIKLDGIEMATAEVPPGTHTLRVDVKDTADRSGAVNLTFTVTK
jgi:hypothetical protein